MIISCPNCNARYRIEAASIAENARMRCARCDHRWVPEAEEVREAPAPAALEPPPEVAPAPPPVDEPAIDTVEAAGSPLLRNIAAITIGGALAIAAGGLWLARIDPGEVPMLGDRFAALAPAPLPLKIAFTAHVSPLPSGELLLQIDGSVANSGTTAIALPDLEARLGTADTTARRWRIAAPTARLGPGASVGFTSTATGFGPDATIVGIRPAG